MESFKQTNLDDRNMEKLALLGLRIERWDILEDKSLSFEERRSKVIESIEADIRRVRELRSDSKMLAHTVAQFEHEISQVRSLPDDEVEFFALGDLQKHEYAENRREFLKNLDEGQRGE